MFSIGSTCAERQTYRKNILQVLLGTRPLPSQQDLIPYTCLITNLLLAILHTEPSISVHSPAHSIVPELIVETVLAAAIDSKIYK